MGVLDFPWMWILRDVVLEPGAVSLLFLAVGLIGAGFSSETGTKAWLIGATCVVSAVKTGICIRSAAIYVSIVVELHILFYLERLKTIGVICAIPKCIFTCILINRY